MNALVNGLKQLLNNCDNLIWSMKQTYLALDFGWIAAAEVMVDSTPTEILTKDKLNEILGLKAKGLRSSILLALGYKDSPSDYLVATKKVGGDQAQLYIHLQYFVSQLKLKICTTKIKDFGECTSSGGSSGEVYYFGYSPLPMICPDNDSKEIRH